MGTGSSIGPDTIVLDVEAMYIRFDVDSNYGNEYYTGLSEVKFYGDTCQVPEPATMLLLGFGLAGLVGVKRKFRQK